MKPRISVIIPCYNCEKYIERCIRSLMIQNCDEIECILVNDGSSDKSQKFIEETIAGCSNFYLINQENQGVSVARNVGIAHAQGDYIGFIDADDSVKENYVTVLLEALDQNPDADIIQFSTRGNEYRATVWSKCIRTSFIKEQQVYFPVGGVLGQDMAFCEKLKLLTDRIVYLDADLYEYALTEGSATSDVKKRFRIYRSIDDLLDFIQERNLAYDEKRIASLIYRHGIIYPLLFIKEKINDKEVAGKYTAFVLDKIDTYRSFLNGNYTRRKALFDTNKLFYVEKFKRMVRGLHG